MRIKNESLERNSESHDVIPKIFVMLEGSDTEPIYFRKLFSAISNIEYLPFEKDSSDLGWSNPLLLMNQLKLELNSEVTDLTYKELMPFLIRHLRKKNTEIDVSLFKQRFNDSLFKNGIKNRNQMVSKQIIDKVFDEIKQTSFVNLVYDGLDDFRNDFENLRGDDHTYNSSIDKLILIVDRDKKSFSEMQYDKVIKNSIKNHIDFYVTNPCFEFFLALHFSDLTDVKKADLLENKRSGNITYVHSLLLEYDPLYTKKGYDPQKYIDNINNVLANLNKYETDICKLKNNVGSNIASLIKKYLHI